MYMQFLSVNNF